MLFYSAEVHDGEEFGMQPVSEFWLTRVKMPRERQRDSEKNLGIAKNNNIYCIRMLMGDVDASLESSALHE